MADNFRIEPISEDARVAALKAPDNKMLECIKSQCRMAERNRMLSDSTESLEHYLERVLAALASAPAEANDAAKKMILCAGLSARYTSLVNNKCKRMVL